MSGVHINLIVGNHDSLRDEEKHEAMVGRQPLSRKAVNLPDDSLDVPVTLPDNLANSIAESIKKIKAGNSVKR